MCTIVAVIEYFNLTNTILHIFPQVSKINYLQPGSIQT